MSANLPQDVFRALDNAIENGYDEVEIWSIDEVVDDLKDYDADLQDVPADQLWPWVAQWRALRALNS